jgi:hypothetical protein
MKISLIQIIQAMLVPGVMVSACALLLLGVSNKYSMIASRIRLLKDEERKIRGRIGGSDGERADNIAAQLPRMMERLRLVRNTVFAYSIGIGLFIVSSLFLGMQFLSASKLIQAGIVATFLAGMICVFAGVVHNVIEIYKGYEIVRIETELMVDGEEE